MLSYQKRLGDVGVWREKDVKRSEVTGPLVEVEKLVKLVDAHARCERL